MFARKFGSIWLPCLAGMGCAGCSRAPSLEIVGTFFPAWMFCIIAALALAGLIRLALVRWGLEQKLGPLVVFYPSLTVAGTCLLWLIFFS